MGMVLVMNILFTICGRAGSKGFKNKNLKEMRNVPLVFFTLAAIKGYANKHFENEDRYPYCTFDIDSLVKISENKFIISFKSEIVADRDQYNYYITDNKYSDETIYYFLNIEGTQCIDGIICSTKENSYLFYDEKDNTFYFMFNKAKDSCLSLKDFLEDYNFIEIISDDLNCRNIFVEKRNILVWNSRSIYLGKIFSNNMEIIKSFKRTNKEGDITLVMFNPNYIICGFEKLTIEDINGNNRAEDSDNNDNDD